jgi:transketolase
MRRAFAETLTQLAGRDPRIALVTGDLGFQVFDAFEAQFKGRYVNVGVAEAQMIYTAAGMAMAGWRPVAYSIASFATARPFEQIRYCVAYPKLPVVVVGAGRGYLYSTSGVSHHAPDDLALMTALPGMTVVTPGDPVELAQLLPHLFELSGPSYLSVGRFGEPIYRAVEPAVLGRARLLRRGKRVAVLCTGEIAHEVLKGVDGLEVDGILPMVYQMHTVKPLDSSALDRLAQEVESLIVVEEHVPSGGLWAAVCDWAAGRSTALRLARLGPPDAFALGNLKQGELRRRWGFDAAAVGEACRQAWRNHLPPMTNWRLSSSCTARFS